MSLPTDVKNNLEETVDEVRKRSAESGKCSMFSIGTTMNVENKDYFVSSVREGTYYVGSNLMVSSISDLKEILSLIDGRVEEILIDVEKKKEACINLDEIASRSVVKSKLGFFRGNQAAASAFEHIVISYCLRHDRKLGDLTVCVLGTGHLGAKVVNMLVEHGVKVDVYDIDQERAASVVSAVKVMSAKYSQGRVACLSLEEVKKKRYTLIVGATNGIEVVTEEIIDTLDHAGFVIDVGLRTVSKKAIEKANKEYIPVFCLMSLPGFNGIMTSHYEAGKLVSDISNRQLKEGFSLVSGGIMGAYGDIIVDSTKNPTRVIGVAKGNGLVLTDEEKDPFVERIEIVKRKYIKEKA